MEGAATQDIAKQAVTRWAEMKLVRAPYDQEREELKRMFKPFGAGHLNDATNPDTQNWGLMLNSMPQIAKGNITAGLYSALNNPADQWIGVEIEDPELRRWGPAREWEDIASDRLLKSYGTGISNFYDEVLPLMGDVVWAGNGCMYDEIDMARGRILDRTIPLGQVCVDYDHHGDLIEVMRAFDLAPRAAARLFGADRLPKRIREGAEKGETGKQQYLHWVMPNDAYVPGRLGVAGKAFVSVYVCAPEGAVVQQGGYHEMPYDYPGWEREAHQAYARGMGHIALASARRLMLSEESNQRAAALAGNPPMAMADVRPLRRRGSITPGAVLMGAIDQNGRRLIQPVLDYSGVPVTKEMADRAEAELKEAFNWTLMAMVSRSGMSATEILERQEERARIMAPHMGRLQTQFMEPKARRRFLRLLRAGQIPMPPPELGGASVKIRYETAAAKAQQSAAGVATLRWAMSLAQLQAAGVQGALDRVDGDALAEVLHQASNVPNRVMRSPEAVAELRAQAAQQAQMAQIAQMASMARDGAGAARDLAQAGAVAAP